MPIVDPKIRFWISFAVFIAVGISDGTVHLTNAIPAWLIPGAVAWCGIISFAGAGLVTGLNGLAMTNQSRLASAAAIPEVKEIVTTSQVLADAGGDKVVTK